MTSLTTPAVLLESCARCPDPDERQRLQHEVLMLNLRLADGIAAGYAGRGIERDDLVQVARLGLLKAIVGYHPGEGPGLTAYARPTISGEIKPYFRAVTGNALIDPSDTSREVGENSHPRV